MKRNKKNNKATRNEITTKKQQKETKIQNNYHEKNRKEIKTMKMK